MAFVRRALRLACEHIITYGPDKGWHSYLIARARDYLLCISSDPTASGILGMLGRNTISPPKALVHSPCHAYHRTASMIGLVSELLPAC